MLLPLPDECWLVSAGAFDVDAESNDGGDNESGGEGDGNDRRCSSSRELPESYERGEVGADSLPASATKSLGWRDASCARLS